VTDTQARERIAELELDLPNTPAMFQADMRKEIIRLREQLGLKVTRTTDVGKAEPKPPNHTQAREWVQAYLTRKAELDLHRAYAQAVAKATDGPSTTPVKPLATMGCNGGPLLCDHCGKPIVLEGGRYQGVPADKAWEMGPPAHIHPDNWKSYIFGGVVIEIVENGTLRVYHGHIGYSDTECSAKGKAKRDADERAHTPTPLTEITKKLAAYLRDEFEDLVESDLWRMVNDVISVLFRYDPGIGINRSE
jgi:hypothetical protein